MEPRSPVTDGSRPERGETQASSWIEELADQLHGGQFRIEGQGSTLIVSDEYAWVASHHGRDGSHTTGVTEAARIVHRRLEADKRFMVEPVEFSGSNTKIVARLWQPVNGIDTLLIQYSRPF